MNIEILETFRNLAKTKNFSRTAELMYLSQSTVTKRIKMLENELGKELIDRKSKGLKLTPAGELTLQYADKILGLCNDCVSSVNDLYYYDSNIVIESTESVWYSYLYPSVMKYIEHNPRTSFKFIMGHTDNIIEDLVNGIIDLGIAMAAVKNSDIESIPYFEDSFSLVAAPDFKMEDDCITPENIRKYNFVNIMWGENFQKWYQLSCGYKGHPLEVEQFNLLLYLLKQGDTMGFFPNRNVKPFLKKGKLISIPFDFGLEHPKDNVNLVYLKKNSSRVKPLLQQILSDIEQPVQSAMDLYFW